MKHRSPHIVFAGGGTLGHLFPGLAVAAELKRISPEARITFAGSGKAAEQRQVVVAGFEYMPMCCRPRRRGVVESLRFAADNLRGLREASRYLSTHRVDAVIGLGGYASFAMGRSAASAGVPLILLEQNAWPGRATRHLARHAALICVSFTSAKDSLKAGCPIRVTGNPVRQSGTSARPRTKAIRRRLLVLGGSQGARSLNEAVPTALARLSADLAGWYVVHQTGEDHVAGTMRRYEAAGVAAHVRPFIENLPLVMADSDLAISRAGGTTLAELAAAGLPAVLAPYPAASEDHQRMNASVYAAAGGCKVVDGRQCSAAFADQLAEELAVLLASSERREAMSRAMLALTRPAAAWHVANMILDRVHAAQPLRLPAPLAA